MMPTSMTQNSKPKSYCATYAMSIFVESAAAVDAVELQAQILFRH